MALQSKTQIKLLFPDLETIKKITLGSILEKLNQSHNHKQASLDDFHNERCASTQFVEILKSQLSELQEELERQCNVLPEFGFNRTKYDLKPIKP